MATVSEDNTLRVGSVLNDNNRLLAERFRALFTLRNLGGSTAIAQISECLTDPTTTASALLKHECAYCLGQMRDELSLPVLKKVLSDTAENPMVRHEAGEAIAAIGNSRDDVLAVLQQHVDDPSPEVAETCRIAIDKLKWQADNNDEFVDNNLYRSIDPAPPTGEGNVKKWSDDLVNTDLSLFARYRAMFSLRNVGGDDAVKGLVRGLSDSSTLFKHEIAYVLGQMQEPLSVKGLRERLSDLTEHAMVRHECAEALGSIASPECLKILEDFSQDKEKVVRDSCVVALDMYTHEHSNEFQYANVLSKVN